MNWISVKDDLPNKNKPVAVCFINIHGEREIQVAKMNWSLTRNFQGEFIKDKPIWTKCGAYKQESYGDNYDAGIDNVTHWSELEFPEEI